VITAAMVSAGGREQAVPSATRLTLVPVAEDTLAFIDLRRGKLLRSVPIGHEIPGGGVSFAQGGDHDWLATESGSLFQIDPGHQRIARSISLGMAPAAIAVGFGSVWVVAQDQPVLLRVDPRFGAVERRYRLPTAGVDRPDFFTGVATAGGSVWVAQGEERVVRIDSRSGRTLARIHAAGATALAGDAGALWVAGGGTGALYRIDPVATRSLRACRSTGMSAASRSAVATSGR
jgi:streptogramin lyase